MCTLSTSTILRHTKRGMLLHQTLFAFLDRIENDCEIDQAKKIAENEGDEHLN